MKDADLNNAFKYDKIILSIDGKSCLSTNPDKSSYYLDLLEPLRNVVYIKILSAVIPNSGSFETLYKMNKNDPIYICLNDYNRSKTYINSVNISTSNYLNSSGVTLYKNTSNYLFNTAEYFELFIYKAGSSDSTVSYTQASFDWTDPTVYILNPPEPNLRRLNIEIKDKKFNLFNTSTLTGFNLTICVYFMKNRV
jgi:hypothetical protein